MRRTVQPDRVSIHVNGYLVQLNYMSNYGMIRASYESILNNRLCVLFIF